MQESASRYAHDVFISYTHLDNQPLLPGEKGWVSELHEVLAIRLSMLRGQEARIWRDLQLRRNDVFGDSIAEAVRSTKLFLSVLTPRYVRSDYCQREVQEFAKSGDIRTAGRSRLFKVMKTPVPRKNHPAAMQNILGYEFYDFDEETRHLREYRVDSRQYRESYLSRLDDLAQEIQESLEIIDRGEACPGQENTSELPLKEETPTEQETIYVCTTSSDVRDAHDLVRRELSERGHCVIPDRPFTLETNTFEREVQEALKRAELSVHIIGERYGIIPEDGEKSIVEIQNEIAANVSRRKYLDRIIWIPEDVAPNDHRQAQFIENLKNDADAQYNADLVIGSVEELKSDILSKLKEIAKRKRDGTQCTGRAQSVPPTSNGALPWVYLIKGPYDGGEVSILENCLWDTGMEVLTLSFDEALSEQELSEEHQANLRQADICIVYYGQSPERWVRKQLCDIRKAGGRKREKPMLASAVYIGGGGQEAKSRFRTNIATVIWPNGAEPAEAIASFITVLEESQCAS